MLSKYFSIEIPTTAFAALEKLSRLAIFIVFKVLIIFVEADRVIGHFGSHIFKVLFFFQFPL